MNRRDFLKRAGATVTGAEIMALAFPQDKQADVAGKPLVYARKGREQENKSVHTDSMAPISPAMPHEQPVSMQDTPTPDATVTTLQKRLLQDQINQLEAPLPSWLETNLATLVGSLGTAATISVGIWQFNKTLRNDQEKQAQQQAEEATNKQAQEERRLEDQRIDREKRDEDRFQMVVSGLGSTDMATRTGAAVLLRTFLDTKYKESYQRFYQQIFELTVAHLRLREVKVDDYRAKPDQFYKEIIKLFIRSAPLIVERLREEENVDLKALAENKMQSFMRFDDKSFQDHITFELMRGKYLDASGVNLKGADMTGAYLNYLYMPYASLDYADLRGAELTYGVFHNTSFNYTKLSAANLSEADLSSTTMAGVSFIDSDPFLPTAGSPSTILQNANLSEADLSGSSIENAKDLHGTSMGSATGLTEEQKQKCEAKGALFLKLPSSRNNL